MEQEKIKIIPLRELLKETDLQIPEYQRPYRWKADKHVKQLLEDLYGEFQKKTEDYRIGTIILHQNDLKKTLDIVDGQQRLVTLSLILLGYQKEGFSNPIKNQEFRHPDSKDNIKYNYGFIKAYLQNLENEAAFLEYILDHSFLVKITLKEISEAFQLFDSQNARGKTLEPSNLLKAYHLRSMQDCSPEIKKSLVEKWEYYDESKILDKVLGEHLFRLRRWLSKEFDYFLTKDDLDDFKGINVIDNIKNDRFYPFIKSTYALSQSIHYQIQEPIVNGRRFFDYVLHYIERYKDIKDFIQNNNAIKPLFEYMGLHRTGDQYLLNLYENVLLLYVDKFGHDENYIQFAKELYRWVFSERVNNTRVGVNSILKLLGQKNNPIFQLTKWYATHILLLRVSIPKIGDIPTGVKDYKEIVERIKRIEDNK
jgi:hypothetical protein